MTLREAIDAYKDLSGRASDVGRKLAFAGIAVIWVFSGGIVSAKGSIAISQRFFDAGLCLTIALVLDFLQYLVATAMWGVFTNRKERKGAGPDEDVGTPSFINWPADLFFELKSVGVVVGYIFLAIGLSTRISW
jgi:hypothetical protein